MINENNKNFKNDGIFNQNKLYFSLLLPIIIISYLIKIHYYEAEIGLTFDSLGYFFYAVDISVLGHLPENYSLANISWPIFLSLFFQLFQFENTIQYMDLQKNLAMLLSTLTIIPVYLIARKFFEIKYSLIAAFIFAIEPHLLQNSMLGIIEPLYILLGTITILFFLSSNKKIVYFSFIFAAFTAITRGEGQVLFFIISIMFLIRYRKEKFVVLKYMIGLGIFVLILMPMIVYQTEVQGHDTIFGRAAITISYHTQDPNETDGGSGLPFFINGVENFSKFFVWDMIPIFIMFIPIGIFYLFKNPDWKKLTLILASIGISIPAFYAYSIPLLDTRYLFMLYPIFCIVSIFAIKKYSSYFKRKNIILGLIVASIFISSLIYLEIKNVNNYENYEIYQITKKIVSEPKIVNSYYPQDHYNEPAILPEKWDDFKNLFLVERTTNDSVRNSILNPIKIISTDNYVLFEDYIKENPELTHIYVDQNEDRPEFLKDIYHNEDQYEFLKKEFDSKNYGYNYHVKIFKIGN